MIRDPTTLILSLYISARWLFTKFHYEQDVLSVNEYMLCFILSIPLIIRPSKIKKNNYFSALTINDVNETALLRDLGSNGKKISHCQDHRWINFEGGNFPLIHYESRPPPRLFIYDLENEIFFPITFEISKLGHFIYLISRQSTKVAIQPVSSYISL